MTNGTERKKLTSKQVKRLLLLISAICFIAVFTCTCTTLYPNGDVGIMILGIKAFLFSLVTYLLLKVGTM